MSATIITQPIASSPGIPAGTVAVATTNQLSRVSQATRSGAGQLGGARIITADTNISSTDTYLGADCTANAVTLTLTKVSEYRSAIYYAEQYKAGHTFTIAARGADTIDGAGTLVVTKLVKLFPIDNATWHVVVIGS